jgi:fructose-1,6-bisphosphatase/sedoheptulose 1,7-bisphosphatase-like protein
MKIDNPEGVNLQRLIELEAQVMRPGTRVATLGWGHPRSSFNAGNFDVLVEFVVVVAYDDGTANHVVWSGVLRVVDGTLRAELFSGVYDVTWADATRAANRKLESIQRLGWEVV